MFAKPGDTYCVYAPEGGAVGLDLRAAEGDFSVAWFNPRTGGELVRGSTAQVRADGGVVDLGRAPRESKKDWVILVRRVEG